MSPPFKVKAVYDYSSPHDDDLNFAPGQIITVLEDDEEDWYTGEYVDASGVKQEGIFPRNFVEKYEPTAPPRPNRAARPKKEVEPPPAAPAPEAAPSPVQEHHEERLTEEAHLSSQEPPAPIAPKVDPAPAPVVSKPPPASAPKATGPPPVAEKPSGGSFKDRIAAFNKTSAPPPAPFKPGGLSSGNSAFIKKPFVAPPPSKDAYVPPPRESAPQKIYRRDEDPEIAAKEAENQNNAEKAGLAPNSQEGGEEDQPKPTSLKERIALLQKQQMEQAARHAEAAQKKEKPKRPPKKRSESHGMAEGLDEAESVPMEEHESQDTVGKASIDSNREEAVSSRNPPRRKSSKGPPVIPDIPRESFGDGNEADMSGAGDETEELEDSRDDSDDKPRARAPAPPVRAPTAPLHEPNVGEEEGAVEEEEEAEEEEEEEEGEEEDEETAEVRRREEIRARMAKMSGGMGMYGMFGAGGMPMPGAAPTTAPKKKKPSAGSEKAPGEAASPTTGRAPPVPIMALPGMSRVRSPEESNKQIGEVEREDHTRQAPITGSQHPNDVPDVEDIKPAPAPPVRTERPPPSSTFSHDSFGAPPVPGSRPAPPPVPTDSRPPPLTTRPTGPMSPSAGSESDDEMSLHGPALSQRTPTTEAPMPFRPPPPSIPARPAEGPTSPTSKRASYFNDQASPSSPTTPGLSNKRTSRVPPIPGASPVLPAAQTRPPPPPPPNAPLSRSSTGDVGIQPPVTNDGLEDDEEEEEEEVTEYEGDYDTDIASTAPHKDALKGHTKDSSIDDETPVRSPVLSPTGAPPPLPPVSAPRAVPPPPPSQAPPRRSTEVPRAAPPPPPPPKEQRYDGEDGDEYDPYRYTAGVPSVPPTRASTGFSQKDDEELYSVSPPRVQPNHPHERSVPQPPGRAPTRASTELQRSQTLSRRSTDLGSMSTESGFIANDVDLGEGSMWWTHPNALPPVFSGRTDILYESEESTATKRGGKSTTTKDLYILFQDYSQTVINVRFDANNPSDATLEQRHEQPPARLRQDQLEDSYERFGRKISDAVNSKKDTVVADGTPYGLVNELLGAFPDALRPVGTRAYGALVYGNMANSSVSQHDEIRPGDIVSMRNAKFQGKHGPMHGKYSMDVGGGQGHVAVVAEWDGTKKKIRAWEQGRDSRKVKLESFKLDDLRSGEVKVWRVMPRSWVGWEGDN